MQFNYPNYLEAALPKLLADLKQFWQTENLQANTLNKVNLVLDELLTNILLHGLQNAPASEQIKLQLTHHLGLLKAELKDKAPPFNITEHIQTPQVVPLQERHTGGLGLYLAQTFADSFHYHYENPWNIAQITFKLEA